MSDYDNYDENLAFPPTTDRTQSSLDLVDKIEELTKWLDLKSEYIVKLEEENERLQGQLEIAKKGLAFIVAQSYGKDMWDCAKGTLKKIEELENDN